MVKRRIFIFQGKKKKNNISKNQTLVNIAVFVPQILFLLLSPSDEFQLSSLFNRARSFYLKASGVAFHEFSNMPRKAILVNWPGRLCPCQVCLVAFRSGCAVLGPGQVLGVRTRSPPSARDRAAPPRAAAAPRCR